MFKGIKYRFVFAVVTSALLIIINAFRWSIVDRITLFLLFPLEIAVWLLFFVSILTSISCLIKIKKIGARSFIPLGVMVFGFIVIVFVPFTYLWLKIDFYLYKDERNEIVDKVLSGELKSNVDYNADLIALDNSYPLVSMGGNEIVVEGYDSNKYILFYTFRGILDNYSGFLYVPKGGKPSKFSDLWEESSTQIALMEENWYYVSHH